MRRVCRCWGDWGHWGAEGLRVFGILRVEGLVLGAVDLFCGHVLVGVSHCGVSNDRGVCCRSLVYWPLVYGHNALFKLKQALAKIDVFFFLLAHNQVPLRRVGVQSRAEGAWLRLPMPWGTFRTDGARGVAYRGTAHGAGAQKAGQHTGLGSWSRECRARRPQGQWHAARST